jgi:hypothetical protein
MAFPRSQELAREEEIGVSDADISERVMRVPLDGLMKIFDAALNAGH